MNMLGSTHPTGVTRLKMCVNRSLKILLIVFYSTLSAHIFSLVKPLLGRPDYKTARTCQLNITKKCENRS
jgi:hypothetical protein